MSNQRVDMKHLELVAELSNLAHVIAHGFNDQNTDTATHGYNLRGPVGPWALFYTPTGDPTAQRLLTLILWRTGSRIFISPTNTYALPDTMWRSSVSYVVGPEAELEVRRISGWFWWLPRIESFRNVQQFVPTPREIREAITAGVTEYEL